jgi:hypothetical protein
VFRLFYRFLLSARRVFLFVDLEGIWFITRRRWVLVVITELLSFITDVLKLVIFRKTFVP